MPALARKPETVLSFPTTTLSAAERETLQVAESATGTVPSIPGLTSERETITELQQLFDHQPNAACLSLLHRLNNIVIFDFANPNKRCQQSDRDGYQSIQSILLSLLGKSFFIIF